MAAPVPRREPRGAPRHTDEGDRRVRSDGDDVTRARVSRCSTRVYIFTETKRSSKRAGSRHGLALKKAAA